MALMGFDSLSQLNLKYTIATPVNLLIISKIVGSFLEHKEKFDKLYSFIFINYKLIEIHLNSVLIWYSIILVFVNFN